MWFVARATGKPGRKRKLKAGGRIARLVKISGRAANPTGNLERLTAGPGPCETGLQERPPAPRSAPPDGLTRLGRLPGDHSLFAASAEDESRLDEPARERQDRRSVIVR